MVSMSPTTAANPSQEIKVYAMRWVIIFLLFFGTASSAMQNSEYVIVADTIVDYYETPYMTVQWTSLGFTLVHVVFALPGSYIIARLGIRKAMVIGVAGTCIGSWIKLASVSPERFWIVLLGQTVVGCSQVFMNNIFSKVASVWFGPKELSTACFIGALGSQIGTSLGFLIPPMLINYRKGTASVEHGLYLITILNTTVATGLLIFVCIFFQERPPVPPSLAQLNATEKQKNISFKKSLKKLFLNAPYLLCIVPYIIITCVTNAFMHHLNKLLLNHYPDAVEDIGRIAMLSTVSGMFGTILCGIVLDRLNHFKATIVTLHLCSIISFLTLTLLLDKGILGLYLVAVPAGAFMTTTIASGFEVFTELGYPVQESTSTGFAMTTVQATVIPFNYLQSYLLDSIGGVKANLTYCGLLSLGGVIISCIPFELKRRNMQKASTT